MRNLRLCAALLLGVLGISSLHAQDDIAPPVLLFNGSISRDSDKYGSDLYAYDPLLQGFYRITPVNSATEYDFSVAPDGQHLVWSIHSGTSGQLEVTELNADGTAPMEWGNTHRLAWNNSVTKWNDAAWSPVITNETGTLAYTTNDDSEKDFKEWLDTDIWLVDIPLRKWTPEERVSHSMNGGAYQSVFSNKRRLTLNDACNEYDLAWSPDGAYIAYVCYQTGGGEIYVQATNGVEQDIRRITDNEFSDIAPSWSPDGQWLVFSSNRAGRPDHDIYKMNLTTGEVVQLTTSWTNDSTPVWSPDGKYIAFQAGVMLALMKPDGTGMRVIERGSQPTWVANPTWMLRAPRAN